MKEFLKRKNIEPSLRRYFIDAMGSMAHGLFASLLIGTILDTLGTYVPLLGFLVSWEIAPDNIINLAASVKGAAGPAMAIAIAYTLKSPPLALYSCAAVGLLANTVGGPVAVLIAAIVAAEFGKAVSKETKVDILVTPLVTILSGSLVALLVGPPISSFMTGFGDLIQFAMTLQPLLMSIIVSALVGIALTLPISSAALCMMLGLGGLAAGAATAGCCAQMIGFAVMSFRENHWGGLASQGLGTSMLQMPNIVKNPRIWIPPTVVSMITGPIATLVFKMENIPIGAGMGTCGLVGPIGVIAAMPEGGTMMWVGILMVCFVLPAVLTPLVALPLRKIGWIKDGDCKLPEA